MPKIHSISFHGICITLFNFIFNMNINGICVVYPIRIWDLVLCLETFSFILWMITIEREFFIVFFEILFQPIDLLFCDTCCTSRVSLTFHVETYVNNILDKSKIKSSIEIFKIHFCYFFWKKKIKISLHLSYLSKQNIYTITITKF